MIRESREEAETVDASFSVRAMLPLAVATSIDALAVGISPLGTEPGTNIFLAVALIGVITCGLCVAGVKIGNLFGSRYEKGARLAGGIILILLGTKILVEHLMEHGASI
jgi:putative Mn2+ efflux pump MntP